MNPISSQISSIKILAQIFLLGSIVSALVLIYELLIGGNDPSRQYGSSYLLGSILAFLVSISLSRIFWVSERTSYIKAITILLFVISGISFFGALPAPFLFGIVGLDIGGIVAFVIYVGILWFLSKILADLRRFSQKQKHPN